MRMWRSGNASPCRGEDPGPIPGIRSRGALDQLAGVTALRPQECGFESRGRYSWPCDRMVQVPACKAGDVGSNPAEASRLDMESEPARCRASLLTRARRKPWDSSSPLSAMEDEPVRVSASSGTRTGAQALGFECSVLRHGR